MPLSDQPRFRLATLPTPLEEAVRLRQALGGQDRCPRILIKRDDLTGLAFGGNKARKLEFLIADALAQRATAVVTTGATQSNHARMTAAAACVAGLSAALVLTGTADGQVPRGNLLLDRLFGATIHFIPPSPDPLLAVSDSEAVKVAEVMADLEAKGERPYLIPVGGSGAVGVFGYVAGTLELIDQLLERGEAPTRLYYASGSRGTEAGLALGARMFSASYRLHGIAVSGGESEKKERARRIATEAADRLGVAARVTDDELHTDQRYIGDGYGIPTPGCLEAILLLARQEGILLDPVYSAKAMAGLIDHVRRGEIDPSETVVFLHTGGTPALFAQAERLALD